MPKELNSTPKREARKLLGLMDDNFNNIPDSQKSREALLVTIEMQSERIKNQDVGFTSRLDSLLSIVKSAKQAKALANKRADNAEIALRQVRSALKVINTLTEETKQDA